MCKNDGSILHLRGLGTQLKLFGSMTPLSELASRVPFKSLALEASKEATTQPLVQVRGGVLHTARGSDSEKGLSQNR